LARLQGDVERTETLADRALSHAREFGDAHHIGLNLEHLAWVARERGQSSMAIDLARRALEHLWPVGEAGTVAEVIELVAALELDEARAERAATLLGAASALRERSGESLPPAHGPALGREVAAATAGLGESRFTSAFAAGEAMRADEALEFALGRR
jgi:hypothetical protein